MTTHSNPVISVIITAAGSSTRMGGSVKKEYLPLGQGTVLSASVNAFQAASKNFLYKLNNISDDFDEALRTLGSFYEDEKRAHEELKDMTLLVKKCKNKIRNYKLPIIHDNYFVEMDEAIEAIGEVEKEVNNKPIIIKNLNTRVDTAKDLTFKLYATASDMVKYAYFSELLIVFGNKYRDNKDINRGLSKAELLYYRGSYKESFNLLLKVIKVIDSDLVTKINKVMKS